jgi:predicted DNA-binding transcriptional regulator AlpA
MTIKKIWHRISELKQIDGVPDSTRYDWIKKGLHPKPRKLGPRVSAFHDDDMQAHYAKLRGLKVAS